MYIPIITPSTFPLFFFFNDTATTEIYTLSLHDALPIFDPEIAARHHHPVGRVQHVVEDRKSTRLNSSHSQISYAVFCLKKKKTMTVAILGEKIVANEPPTISQKKM